MITDRRYDHFNSLFKSGCIMSAGYFTTWIYFSSKFAVFCPIQARLCSYLILIAIIMSSGIIIVSRPAGKPSDALELIVAGSISAFLAGWSATRCQPGFPILPLILDVSILVYSTGLAEAAAGFIKNRTDLLLVLVLVSFVDVISVYFGPAREIVSTGIARFFIFNFPLPAIGDGGFQLHLVFANVPDWFHCDGLLGFGDAFFAFLLLRVTARDGLHVGKASLLIGSGLAIAGAVSHFSGVVPALPFITAMFLAGFKNHFGRGFGVREWRLLAFGLAASVLFSILIIRLGR